MVQKGGSSKKQGKGKKMKQRESFERRIRKVGGICSRKPQTLF
jgi:hypothetical protein